MIVKICLRDGEEGLINTMTEAKAAHEDIEQLTFEAALKELESIVERLESGEIELAESIAAYERGGALKNRCEALLKQAEKRVEKITLNADGTVSGVEPLDEDEA